MVKEHSPIPTKVLSILVNGSKVVLKAMAYSTFQIIKLLMKASGWKTNSMEMVWCTMKMNFI